MSEWAKKLDTTKIREWQTNDMTTALLNFCLLKKRAERAGRELEAEDPGLRRRKRVGEFQDRASRLIKRDIRIGNRPLYARISENRRQQPLEKR